MEPFSGNLGASMPVLQTLVLDSEKRELVQAPGKVVGNKGGITESKMMAALKSHSEAERRRREKINAHLTTFRGLLPCTEKEGMHRSHSSCLRFYQKCKLGAFIYVDLCELAKNFYEMDKATLLAQVICQVKKLKKAAAEGSEGFLIPSDADEVRVEAVDEGSVRDGTSFVASLCCDYRPELLTEVRQTLVSLNLNVVKAEISTLGSRVKTVISFTRCKENNRGNNADDTREIVQEALTTIVDQISASPPEYWPPRATFPNKRRRGVSFFDYSS